MPLNNEAIEYLNIINSYGTQVLSTINDVVDFSDIRSGEVELRHEVIDIEKEIQGIINALTYRALGKKIELDYVISAHVPLTVIADGDKLRQIIMNLADNALNNSNEGKITIVVENLGELEAEKVILVFKIHDTGSGINDILAQELYSALGHHDSSLLLKMKGSGLGLAIAKDLCVLYNGEISFETEPGNGSTFWFTATFDTKIKKVQNPNIGYGGIKRQLKILLVEDNILNQKFVKATLLREGHEIEIAENGKIAIDKFSKNQYDIILMDIQLPIMDGLEATAIIRDLEKNKPEKVKMIAVTAFALEKDRLRCLSAGMDDFLAKPFKPKDLINIINNQAYQ
jgi:CheY-like chemotaxis protein